MKLAGAPEVAKLLLAAVAVSVLATVASLLIFSNVLPLDGSPPRRGIAAALEQISDFDTFVVLVLPQLLVFAVVSFVSMLVAAAIVRNTAGTTSAATEGQR